MIAFVAFWIRLFRQLLDMAFVLVTFLLLAEFVLCIFAPGNADTAGLFKTLQPFRAYLDPVFGFLQQPVHWVEHHLPSALTHYLHPFPAESMFRRLADIALQWPWLADTVAGRDLRSADYHTLFPGVINGHLFMAVAFWCIAEALVGSLFNGLETFFRRLQWWGPRTPVVAGVTPSAPVQDIDESLYNKPRQEETQTKATKVASMPSNHA